MDMREHADTWIVTAEKYEKYRCSICSKISHASDLGRKYMKNIFWLRRHIYEDCPKLLDVFSSEEDVKQVSEVWLE